MKIKKVPIKVANVLRPILSLFGFIVSRSGNVFFPTRLPEFDVRPAVPQPSDNCLKQELVCRRCRQVLANRSNSLHPWYLHECYKVYPLSPDPEFRQELAMLAPLAMHEGW